MTVSQSLSNFEKLATDLCWYKSETTFMPSLRLCPEAQFLGIGRMVELAGRPVGVFARANIERYHSEVVVDFIDEPYRIGGAQAIYHLDPSAEQVTVNNPPARHEENITLINLARDLGGLALTRQRRFLARQYTVGIVSDEELDFVTGFVRDPDNSFAMYNALRAPGQNEERLKVMLLDMPRPL